MASLNAWRLSVYGYYGQGNAGDEAILEALIMGIKNICPTSVISVYSALPEETIKRHQVLGLCKFNLSLKSILGN